MHPRSATSTTDESRATVVVRRFRGRAADELHLLCTPGDAAASEAAGDTAAQLASAYSALASTLDAEGLDAACVVAETVFLADPASVTRRGVLDARRAAFGDMRDGGPAITTIGQAPLAVDAGVALLAVVVAEREAHSATSSEVRVAASCTCRDCAGGLRGLLRRSDAGPTLRAAGIHGRGEDAFAQALDAFGRAAALLAEAGMDFRDVVRTWIHLRDIDRDYDALNRARRDFFAEAGVKVRPASTGVQGIPLAAAHDVELAFVAMRRSPAHVVARMSTPTLNEAWTYGADFSRGLRVEDEDRTALWVSGTASLDETGASVHDGDLVAQASRMLRNLETLLAEQGAAFGDVVSAVTYVKRAADGPAVRGMLEAAGFGGFPLVVVEAPLCRPELLCETEALALLPSAGSQ